MYIHIHIYIYVCVYVYIYTYIHVYICVSIYMYMHMAASFKLGGPFRGCPSHRSPTIWGLGQGPYSFFWNLPYIFSYMYIMYIYICTAIASSMLRCI